MAEANQMKVTVTSLPGNNNSGTTVPVNMNNSGKRKGQKRRGRKRGGKGGGGEGCKNIQPLQQQQQQHDVTKDKRINFCCNCSHQIEQLQQQHHQQQQQSRPQQRQQQQTSQRPKQQQQQQEQVESQNEKVEGRNIIYLTNRAKLVARAELLVEAVPFRLPKSAGST